MRRGRRRRAANLLAVVGLLTSGCGGGRVPNARSRDCRGGKIWHSDDVDRLRGCLHIEGALHLGGALPDAMALEGLSSIEGDLIIGPSYQLINLAQLGSVVRIGGDLRVEGNWRLRGLFMGRLAHLGGELIVEDNSGLVALVFPSLVESGKVRIVRNGSLERVDLSSLESAGPKGTVSGASLEEVKAPLRIQRLTEDAAENAAKGS